MPISRLKAKILANCASLIGALLMLTLLFTTLNNKALIDELGKAWVNAYQESYSSEVPEALVKLQLGQTDHAINLLEQSDWSSVRLGDRGYRFKRQILSNLCRTLYNNKDYHRLLYWATAWQLLDERDVDAIAYNYEALRQTDGRRKEGREGLLDNFKKFPKNEYLQRFYVWALFDAGEVEQATELAEKYLSPDWVRNATVGWELRWQWKARHVITNYVRHLKQDLANGEWGDAWKASQDIWRQFLEGKNNDLSKEIGYLKFLAFPNQDNRIHITADIPRNISKVRIDLPPHANLRISEFNLTIDGDSKNLPPDAFEYINLWETQGTIQADRDEDPFFLVNILNVDKTGVGPLMKVDISFQISLIDVLGRERLLSYELAKDSRFSWDGSE
ncbi:TPA: hypothetical protein EYM26_15140 [Candidatus Poribacteria bacterium]|nr:hypothetical protein [Candidatus Poribacteria bacterium]